MRMINPIALMLLALLGTGCGPEPSSGGSGGGLGTITTNPGGGGEGGGGSDVLPSDIKYKAVITPSETFGRRTDIFFYDIKGINNVIGDAAASVLFADMGVNGIRLPIYGDKSHGGHTAAGQVGDVYTKVIQSVEKARSKFSGGKFYTFASKKLDGTDSFPAWVKNSNGVIVDNYVTMLYDFISFMKGKGIEIDILGVDNETNFNEGKIYANVYIDIVRKLKARLEAAGFKIPLFVGPERYNPQTDANYWVKNLIDAGGGDCLDIYGTHYYPKHHTNNYFNALKKEWNMANSDKSRPFWATEPHWDNDDAAKADMLAHSEKAICAIFDQTDLGMDGFMWWGFNATGTDLRANLMKQLSLAIYGAQPCRIIDHDGEGTMTLGKVQSRAYIRGTEVNVFIVNISSTAYKDYYFEVAGGPRAGDISAVQFRDDTPASGSPATVTSVNSTLFRLDIPARSITKLTFSIH